MQEIPFIVAWLLFLLWFLWPMIRIFRSPYTSGTKKALWAVGTFLPFVVAVAMTKAVQALAPSQVWASKLLDSFVGAYLLVLGLLLSGWVVLAVYDHIYSEGT